MSKTWETRQQNFRQDWQNKLQETHPGIFGTITEREGALMQIAERVGYERGYSKAYQNYIRSQTPPKDAA